MNTLPNDKFDFDDDDAFTEEELADLESMSSEDFDLDFDSDFEFDDVDFDDFDDDDWDDEDELSAAEEQPHSVPEGEPATGDLTDFVDEPLFAPEEDDPFKGVAEALAVPSDEVVAPVVPADQDDRPVSETDDATTLDEPGDEVTEEASTTVADSGEEADTAEPSADVPPLVSADDELEQATTEPVPVEVPSVEAAVSAASIEDEYVDVPQEGDHIPVPRINISVFCETQAVSAIVEESAADRRLAKAHVTILMGGIKRAAQHFQHENTPNLLIIETVNGGQELFDGLSALAEVCDPSTKVIVIGAINDIHLYRDLMNRGISEYLISPRSPVQVTRAIASLYIDPSAPPIGRSIVFVGSRGGVGSSTICHNVAWAMAERQQSDTVLLDLDLAFGTASLDFEQDPSQGLAEALLAPERLDDVLLDRLLQKCTDRLSLFAAPNVLDHDYDLPPSAFEEVLDMVRKGVPNLVIDLPHAWTAWTRHVLQTADDIVITATPDLSSFRNAKNLIESVKSSRANDAPPYLVLNQMGVPKRPEIPPAQFAEALEIEPAVIINWEPQLFGLAATNAEPIFETAGKSKAAAGIDQIACLLLGIGGEKIFRSKFNLKSLFRKL